MAGMESSIPLVIVASSMGLVSSALAIGLRNAVEPERPRWFWWVLLAIAALYVLLGVSCRQGSPPWNTLASMFVRRPCQAQISLSARPPQAQPSLSAR